MRMSQFTSEYHLAVAGGIVQIHIEDFHMRNEGLVPRWDCKFCCHPEAATAYAYDHT